MSSFSSLKRLISISVSLSLINYSLFWVIFLLLLNTFARMFIAFSWAASFIPICSYAISYVKFWRTDSKISVAI